MGHPDIPPAGHVAINVFIITCRHHGTVHFQKVYSISTICHYGYIVQVIMICIGGKRMDYYVIGQKIRKFRKAAGLSQEELAELVGISSTHMSHIETGNTKLSLSVLVLIAEKLSVRTDDLLFEKAPASRSAAAEELVQALDGCTEKEMRFIKELAEAAIKAKKKYL